MTCDLCSAGIVGCGEFATWCSCGLYYQACARCVKEYGAAVKGRVRVRHESTHEEVVR